MPFLRAALIKKQLKPDDSFDVEIKQDEIILRPPVVSGVSDLIDEIEEVQELEQAEEVDIEKLQRVIDEKVATDVEEILESEPSVVIDNDVEIAPVDELAEIPENEISPEENEVEIQESENIEAPVIDDVKEEIESTDEIPTAEEVEAEPKEFELLYDVTSGERYVDKVSTKTEFDKMLDELGEISKDLLSWEVEKFAKKYTGKFQGDFEKTESDAKKYEAFLGGYITNAAMILYDNGYKDTAIKKLEQAKNILEARKKLEDETEAIKNRVEEEDATVDLSDILGLFGDG